MKTKKIMKLPVDYNELEWQERKLVREEYIRRQDGICIHCNNPLKEAPSESIMKQKINEKLFPINFLSWPIHLHHDHDTGITIGSVHSRCNAVLWQYNNK